MSQLVSKGLRSTCEVRIVGGVSKHHDIIVLDSERAGGKVVIACALDLRSRISLSEDSLFYLVINLA